MTYLKCGFILVLLAAALVASEHHGVVTFHGMPVPGAVVTATQGDNKITTSTDDDGAYSFRDLPDGNWTIEVQLTGFAKASREIGVAPGAPAPTWELALAPPPSAAATTATAGPPGGRGGPTGPGPGQPGGRGGPPMTPAQAQAAAKERAAAQARAQDQAQSRAAAVAATSGGGGGGDAVLAGSVGSGAAGISGNAVAGSQYNGNANFSLDNSVWDAIPYSLTGIHTPKAAFAKGRIGIAFGGPLKIPHLFNSKSGTFTINYNMGRTRNATTSNATVPTALERTGDFSQSVVQGPVTVYDPTTGIPFPGNKIPGNKLNSIALALASYYPQPNAPVSRLNYQTALVSINNSDNLNARINETLGKNDRLSGGIGWNRSNGVSPNVFSFIDNNSGYGVNGNASWSHNFSKKLFQNFGVNFSRFRNEQSPYFSSLNQDVARQLGILGTSALPLDWGPPSLNFTNFNGLTDGTFALNRNQSVGLNYGLNMIRSKHQIGVGANYQRQQTNPLSDQNGRGSFTFNGAANSTNFASGYDFADFLLNLPAAASVRYGNADKYFRNFRIGTYLQDNWTISKTISANFGIRWDYISPYAELYDRMANLDFGQGFSTDTLVVAGKPGPSGSLPRSLVRGDFSGFSPSVGVAWRPFPKNTKNPTTVRLNFNQSHSLDSYSTIANNLSGQPPFARVLTIASSPANPLNMQTGFLNTPVTANTYAVDPNYKMIIVNSAGLNINQSLAKGYFFSLGVSYLKVDHLDQTSLPNSLAPGLPVPLNGPPSGYIYEESNGKLQGTQTIFQFGRNMASGLSASIFGVLARATDNGAIGAFGGAGNLAQNWQDLAAERARSTLVGRGQVSGNWQYSTGQGKAGGTLLKGWKGTLLKDWTFTNSFNWRAGNPLTATVAGALAGGTGIATTLRADATGQSIDAPSGSGQPFNLAAFTVPLAGHWGTAGRGTIIGPSVWSLNGSMGRVFRLGEKRSADLRFDANNFLNHVIISGWSTVVNAYNYGLPTGTQSMRSLTANLRVRF